MSPARKPQSKVPKVTIQTGRRRSARIAARRLLALREPNGSPVAAPPEARPVPPVRPEPPNEPAVAVAQPAPAAAAAAATILANISLIEMLDLLEDLAMRGIRILVAVGPPLPQGQAANLRAQRINQQVPVDREERLAVNRRLLLAVISPGRNWQYLVGNNIGDLEAARNRAHSDMINVYQAFIMNSAFINFGFVFGQDQVNRNEDGNGDDDNDDDDVQAWIDD